MNMIRQRGISLIELMVGVFVGALLLAGLIQVITNTGRSYQVQDAVLRMQENGQYALEHLLVDLRNTSFFGCLPSMDDISSQLNGGSSFVTFTTGLEGTANEDGSGAAVAGSDTITIRGAANVVGGSSLQAPLPTVVSDPVVIGPNSNIEVDDIVLISDCEAGDIFQVTGIDANGSISHAAGGSNPGNASGDLSKVYSATAFMYQPYTRLYDVRIGTNGVPSLFMTDDNGTQELVQGVENMIILYGEDTNSNGVANRYVRADAVTDMDSVVSVRINLLAQSEQDNMSETPVTYQFNGQTIVPTDNRLRRVYSSTVMLRNRGG